MVGISPASQLFEITVLNHCILVEIEESGPPWPNDQQHYLHLERNGTIYEYIEKRNKVKPLKHNNYDIVDASICGEKVPLCFTI